MQHKRHLQNQPGYKELDFQCDKQNCKKTFFQDTLKNVAINRQSFNILLKKNFKLLAKKNQQVSIFFSFLLVYINET